MLLISGMWPTGSFLPTFGLAMNFSIFLSFATLSIFRCFRLRFRRAGEFSGLFLVSNTTGAILPNFMSFRCSAYDGFLGIPGKWNSNIVFVLKKHVRPLYAVEGVDVA